MNEVNNSEADEAPFGTDVGTDPGPTTHADLPPETPIAMPVQDFGALPAVQVDHEQPLHSLILRRAFLIVGSFLCGLLAAQEMFTPLQSDGVDLIDAAFFLLFFGLFAWIAFGFLNAVAGFFVMLARGPMVPGPAMKLSLPTARTAVLMPIYNEDVHAVFRRLRLMSESVAVIGASDKFDFFILSDSGEDALAREHIAFRQFRTESASAVYYRRRKLNTARKPGNIGDWVRRFGGGYDHMIVLDADSLMSGAAMARLATAMEARPGIGLIQTVPALLNGRTMFARWHQFAAALYGPVGSAGLRWWSGTEATFWGHNAIVRCRAFAESCGLPALDEDVLLGGHIMSHDMVEAALLRRRGWAVHLVMLSDGTYEEYPPTMIDHAIRDRRWCQGNLQHLRLLHTRGLHWISRLQLVMGASAYLTSPLWLLLIFAGIFEQVRADFDGFLLISSGWLLALTLIFLFGPKVVALVALSLDDALLKSLGGWRKVLRGVVVEILISIVTAPVTMLTQTMAIVSILRGRHSGWSPQRRETEGLLFGEALRYYRWHLMLGAVLVTGIVAGVDGSIWTLPVAVGLLLAPATAWLSSRALIGDWLVRHGMLLSPADSTRFDTPPEDEAALTLQPAVA